MSNQPESPNYDFINEPGLPKKSFLPSSNTKKGRILLVIVGVAVLVIIGIIIASLLSSGERALKQDLLVAVQQQTELIRVSEIGMKDAVGTEAKNLAVNTNLSLNSSIGDLVGLAEKAGSDTSPRQVAQGKDEQTDQALEQAKQINRFDEEFTKVMQAQLIEYQKILQTIFQAAQNENTKATLSQMFENAELLVEGQSSDGAWLLLPVTKS